MKTKTYSKSIASIINSFLTEDGWHFTFDDQRGQFRFDLRLNERIKKVSYIINVKDDEYIVYAISPLGADEDDDKMMATMADFLCRANYGLKNGNFELDSAGEIRYKSFVDCEGITPTTEVVHNSVYCPGAMMARYGAGIIDIIFNNATAKEAIEKCEKSPAEELRALLADELDGDEDVDTMIARLAARFGIDESELHRDSEMPESDASEPEVKTKLFETEGGIA